jgi:carboxyl-terminal processing protease
MFMFVLPVADLMMTATRGRRIRIRAGIRSRAMKPKLFAATVALLCALAAAAESPEEARTKVFDDVVKTVNEQFYDPAFHGVDWAAVHKRYRARLREVGDDAALQKLIAQMLDELKSSHLYVSRITPGKGGGGIGARIEPMDGADTVLELAPLSDARAQGLRPGDRIIGGVASLDGPAGSLAEVTVQRCDDSRSQLKIRRERWLFPEEHPGVRWARIRVAPDKIIGYIRADRFDDGFAPLADQAMAELNGTHGLVIDVRTNSGGNISAMRLASYFIAGSPGFALLSRPYLQALGRPVNAADIAAAPKVIGRYRGEDVGEALAKGRGAAVFQFEDLGEKRYRAPVVVLIGPGTGSAAEGFAAAMKMFSKARLVGATTAGAILSGDSFDIAPGWRLTVPVAGHWSMAAEDLNDKAVTPHESVPETRADLCAGRDRGAQRAMAILTDG